MKMSKQFVHQSIACLLAFLVVNVPIWALSASDVAGVPTNATVTNTAPTADYTAGGVLVEVAGRGVVDWNGMKLNTSQILQFSGESGFAVLNRVHGKDGIFFDLGSTVNGGGGDIYFVSPFGIAMNGEILNANKFVASGLNIEDQDFVDRIDRFAPFEGEAALQAGQVINQGTIIADKAALLGSKVLNKGTIQADGGLVVMAAGDQIILGNEGSHINVVIDKPFGMYNVTNEGSIEADGGQVIMASGDKIKVPDDARQAIIERNLSKPLGSSGMYNVVNETGATIQTSGGTIVLAAGDTFAQALPKNTYNTNSYSVNQKGKLQAAQIDMGAANEVALRASGTNSSDNSINIGAQKVRLEKTLEGEGTVTINADYGVNALESITSQDDLTIQAKSVQVRGDVESQTKATIKAETFYSKGSVISEDELLLEAETLLWGDSDQKILSNTSTVTIKGDVWKVSEGSIYILAEQNVQLDGDVTADKGGVSVIAENGMIHSEGSTALNNVSISGYSDDINGDSGVDLPHQNGKDDTGKAAIVLLSSETLILGQDCSLEANGFYLSKQDSPERGVDDRPDIQWLQADGEFIGGWERDEGFASDVAIYAGSKSGNVIVNTTEIQTAQPTNAIAEQIEGPGIPSGPATVIFDAYDTVKMPSIPTILDSREEGNENNFRGFRLEVDSRVTEWLYQAVANGTLPYAYDPEAVEAMLEQDYVLRGAGLNNSDITDGRAWVLENPPMLPTPALADLILPELKGCPVVLDSVANELAINTDDLQIIIGSGLATNPNLQPCEACQRLLDAADVLKDRDGSRMAAINQVFNTMAPIDAPFTPEVTASVSTALADLAQSDPQYAMAGDFVDAFVQYVAVLNSELKVPVGDPMAYALNKYGESLLNSSNHNIISYLIAQIQASSQIESQTQPENI